MEKNKVILTVVSVVALFGLLWGVYKMTNTTETKLFTETKTVNASDHVTWSKDKKHVLTEYGDIQCPACGMFAQFIKSDIEPDKSITSNITFVYRNFPLKQTHQHAEEAAYATEAAGKQGKYFEMLDYLYLHQSEWENPKDTSAYLEGVASKLKLDIEKYRSDKKSSEVRKKVDEDIASGGTVGVNATPTFFLDGTKVDVTTLADFKKLLQDTAKKEKMVE